MMLRLLPWICLGALAPGLGAMEDVTAASAFAFPSVQEGGSARAIALSSAYVGVAEGSAALLWNPAGLSGLITPEIALHHTSSFLGAAQEIALLGLPMGSRGGLGLSLAYEDNGAFEGRDATGQRNGGYAARAYGAGLGWGWRGLNGFSLGWGVKANHRDLAGDGDTAFAVDAGVLWSLDPRLSLGAAYTNFGPEVDGRPLAQGFRLGASSYFNKGGDFQWLLALSGEALAKGESSLQLGLEHVFSRFVALRAGYCFTVLQPDASGLVGFRYGIGILLRQITLDYAYVPQGDLGNVQRISFTYAFSERSPRSPS